MDIMAGMLEFLAMSLVIHLVFIYLVLIITMVISGCEIVNICISLVLGT